MPALADRMAQARAVLSAAGIPADEAALDAEVLARHVLGWDRARLLAEAREAPPPGFEDTFEHAVRRRAWREPVAQITGIREFWGLEFEVSPDVLTPRPETELIVEEALAIAAARAGSPITIIDVGTGSGCLAITLSTELPSAAIYATDISAAALRVARANAARHHVGGRVHFIKADLLDGILAAADIIVSNPPYISQAAAASLPPEVSEHEPRIALFGGQDGLAIYRRLLRDAGRVLVPDGRLILELGYDQHAAVTALAASCAWRVERTRADLQGIPRTIVLEKGRRI